jgi:hypothetical protein
MDDTPKPFEEGTFQSTGRGFIVRADGTAISEFDAAQVENARLKAENEALRHDNAALIEAASDEATLAEKLRAALLVIRKQCFILGLGAEDWPVKDAEAALTDPQRSRLDAAKLYQMALAQAAREQREIGERSAKLQRIAALPHPR